MLVEQSLQSSYDDGDIDDGEHWKELQDKDIEMDLPSVNPQSSEDSSPHSEVSEASTLVSLLSILITKWSSTYGITLTALSSLLKLIGVFFAALCVLFPLLTPVLSLFPKSLHALRTALNLNENNFIKYVACPSCHSIYNFKDCFDRPNKPKTCSHVSFPNHRQQAFRLPCQSRLLAEVRLKGGSLKFYPRKYYCFKPISESLSTLFNRKGFLNSCELWRLRQVPSCTMCDIYDGQIWNDYQYINGTPFLAAPHNLALMLNIDWFRPYKHTPYSVGVIYMVVTNLPRSIRFKKENVILVGIVPGPSEPPLHMNSYLKPLVDELNSLWRVGIRVSSPDVSQPLTIRAALICVACDIPACRKVLGFCGHMSKAGCSKCTKMFGFDGKKINFGGFQECPLRSEHDHRHQAFSALDQTNAAARDKIEKEHGSRFTSLMELAYFDTVRCHIVDPMHNLYLGTSKYVMKQILNTSYSVNLIQERVDRCIVPSSLGRIPHKIASSYSSLTADQWKTWTNIFSIYALHNILPDDQLECWRLFVQASRLLSSPMITAENMEMGHKKLLEFCRAFEAMSGSETVTPNMHLHTHLLNCIKDYGPIYSFWLFSFERYNGLLGSYKTNQRSVELQLMRRFMLDLQTHDVQIPEGFISSGDLDILLEADDGAGTLRDVSTAHSVQYFEIMKASGGPLNDTSPELWSFLDIYHPGGVTTSDMMDDPELTYLAECYSIMYPGELFSPMNISAAVQKYSPIKVGHEMFGSQNSRSKRSSYILANWCGRNGVIDTSSLRPASISYFIKHSVRVNNCMKPHYFAIVN